MHSLETICSTPWTDEEEGFNRIRSRIIGADRRIRTPYGIFPMLYADWCASGRLYGPIERFMTERVGPYVGNTHTDSNLTGAAMTQAYVSALRTIKRHVNAGSGDAVISCGTGMTGAVNKLQRLMGLRLPEWAAGRVRLNAGERPVIFVSHMEHHSNQISWLETVGEVVIVPPDRNGRLCPEVLDRLLLQYRHRPCKIGAFTACSNVTGIRTPIPELARVMHRHGGVIVADYSASAPYAAIDMHPADPMCRLDAVVFSPHKFLGGPGTNGILAFDSRLAGSRIPDQPGGGTVMWTDPWGGKQYVENVEEREDGGTPGFLQAIRTALCLKLKEHMGTVRMEARERRLLSRLWGRIERVSKIRILEERHKDRQAILSFTMEGLHYKLAARLLNDRFGIQARGGCSCAGTYGHYLFGIGPEVSSLLYQQVLSGDTSGKPGWVRISLHPTMNEKDVDTIAGALEALAGHGLEWSQDYVWDPAAGDFRHWIYKEEPVLPDLEETPLQELFQESFQGACIQ